MDHFLTEWTFYYKTNMIINTIKVIDGHHLVIFVLLHRGYYKLFSISTNNFTFLSYFIKMAIYTLYKFFMWATKRWLRGLLQNKFVLIVKVSSVAWQEGPICTTWLQGVMLNVILHMLWPQTWLWPRPTGMMIELCPDGYK